MNDDLNAIEKEIQEAEVVVQSESQPEDPTATHEELSKLHVCVMFLMSFVASPFFGFINLR